jgi:putative Mn2+ efflux pump MntP
MNLDVRLPIGLMFSVFGVLLAVFGLVSDPQIYAEHSLGINVNLGWGLVLLVFGLTMLVLALRARRLRAEPPRDPG